MKPLLLSILFLFTINMRPAEKVFICKGGSAYAYHKTRDWRYLTQCTHKIEEISIEDAKSDYKRKPCKPCYKY